MVLPLVCVLVFPVAIVSIIRAVYLILLKHGKPPKRYARKIPATTLIVLGSGGHTTEILRILRHLNKQNYTPRIYVKAETDTISPYKVKKAEVNRKDYRIIQISRSREVRQSYFTSVWTTVRALMDSFPLVWREKPDLLLCNGPGTCIPLCLVTFFYNSLFLLSTKIVFVESFCRVKSFSLSGRILYYIANHTIVQWPNLNGFKYSRSIFVK
ncbi:UDP-N-acetylglucosamine transferase subunit ALG14 homolog isoform X2 [Phymastichus coffea]|nr:UDP-N-acetylglucosamine transferase subunit ALG14 homolog isoform X2 [Phymastichus coffea]XP_058798774.1 UDP-N-acetylglucosamine transferase subunit ALG14 homolog isoform X2 [Phymastichus coffea]XP_058798775.1 UDP-N-acetylglucosamine transferase subunit ALG14 homolog isoform X2 [Phymastichus coffea]XP_058798776.1 UDP-N-acetylglucosamine transferase subunit ALG14 homolog isoform X2 [Phymastichus coffea]